ncbi:hypothetical protein L1994_06200 [Methanomicrobium antiquum]|uniref:Uncharacterized protein n=1 Tax=Methanomicrobium antiquum TaxID=487686 RepID=A0AAF0JT19_9EURY|nr:hypothetical protein [Methanomicrobium antiquum]MDD3977224.1 hypothetical protein [Methanomicrobium sp.]WFN35758.1 hypothetical protein L1994_06200 [Methanomicrobium antiquum]
MVWIKSLEGSYVNADNILSITFDTKCNSFVAVVGYKESRLQHKIFQNRALDNILAGDKPRSENEIIEEMIDYIEKAKNKLTPNILDFNVLLT